MMQRSRKRKFLEETSIKKKVDIEELNDPPRPLTLRYLRATELGTRTRAALRDEAKKTFFPRQISVLQEREFPCKSYDKAFAAEWADSSTVVVGTKCNNLLRLNVDTGECTQIPLGGEEEATAQPPLHPAVGQQQQQQQGGRLSACGIHAVSLNPSRTLLATGAQNSSQCTVFETGSFTRKQVYQGHKDWVFGIDWIDDERFVTGSRDSSVKIWKYDEDVGPKVTRAIGEHAESDGHQARVRDVKFCKKENRIASVSIDGFMRLWDPERLQCVFEFELNPIHKPEITCMAVQDHLVAVGCRDWIAMMDVRIDHQYWAMELAQPDYSVRSLQFGDNVISCGTGNGWISFVDFRWTQQYLELERPLCRGTKLQKENHLEVGKGWLAVVGLFREYFEGLHISNAVYAHCWDASRSRLFSCGGPLPAGLRGCYMGIWE